MKTNRTDPILQDAGVSQVVPSPPTDSSASASCASFAVLMGWQAERMRAAIDEDKWLLSERAGKDVGSVAAEQDFMKRFLKGCAVDWRREFCGAICSHRNECALGKAMLAAV